MFTCVLSIQLVDAQLDCFQLNYTFVCVSVNDLLLAQTDLCLIAREVLLRDIYS